MRTGSMHMFRYGSLCLVLGFLVPLLSGCWDRTEVNDLALIMAAGLDKKDDNYIELSVEVFVPKGTSIGGGQGGAGTGSTSSSGQTLVRSAYGVTLADAMSKLQKEFPRRIFWGHCEVFIFGEKLAKDSMREQMDFIMREPGPRERAYVFISKGNAREILSLLPPIERSSAEVLREMAKLQTGMKVTVKDFAEMLIGDAQAAALPWIEKLPIEKYKVPNQTVGFLNGTAVIKKDQMVGLLDDKLTRGLLWLRNEIQTSIVTISPKESKGFISMKLLRSSTHLIPKIDGDNWSVTVKLETEDDVMQNTTNLNLDNPEVSESIEKQLADNVARRVRASLVLPQKKWNADIFNFAEAFHRKYPKEWRKAKSRWDEIFPEVKVNIEAKAKIMRTGMATVGASMPENEVQKK